MLIIGLDVIESNDAARSVRYRIVLREYVEPPEPPPAIGDLGADLVDLKPLRRRYDLTPAAAPSRLTLVIGGVNRDINFAPAAFGGTLTDLTAEEVARVIDDALNGNPANATDIIVEVQRDVAVQSVYEVAHSPADPDVIWVGGSNRVWVSTNGGQTWADRYPTSDTPWITPFIAEAIAPDPFPPDDPANPEYTALVGARISQPRSCGSRRARTRSRSPASRCRAATTARPGNSSGSMRSRPTRGAATRPTRAPNWASM